MKQTVSILDQVIEIIITQCQNNIFFTAAEPLSIDPKKVDGIPYRAITIQVNEIPFAVLGLWNSEHSLQNEKIIQPITRRAIARKAPYLILSNLQETIVVTTPINIEKPFETIKKYTLLALPHSSILQELTKPDLIKIEDLIDILFNDLTTLKNHRYIPVDLPDADYFVARLVRSVDILKPAVKKALFTEIRIRPKFAKDLANWATPQGIPIDFKSDVFAEAVVRQAIYRLLGKIIFYQSLHRARHNLPQLDLSNCDTSQVIPRLYYCFSKAHQIDYHAVFREDVIDHLPFPSEASLELKSLVEDLKTRDFSFLPQDVIGAVFEQLIPAEDRHTLGQFFTPEPLVDLITAFCIRDTGDYVLDPTCGTGTFLIRAYDRLKTYLGVKDHKKLLGQLWGVDISPFPAELATINLFRQNVEDESNFPRILNEDFFKIFPGGKYLFPPLKDNPKAQVEFYESIPQFDAIIGNFPYISSDRIESTQIDYIKETIHPSLIDEWFDKYSDGFRFTTIGIRKEYENAREHNLPIEKFKENCVPDLSSNTDLYVYLFWHAASFLKPGGRMGIITSNAWLDVGFGFGLQKFLINNFKIVAIMESRCEPWFEQAAVNTIVTILERCNDKTERESNSVRFTKIKKPFDVLIPWNMRTDALNRWLGIQNIVKLTESVYKTSNNMYQPHSYEHESFRVRCINQGVLQHELIKKGKTTKWGQYLRAPKVYFELIDKLRDKLVLLGEIAPPTRGGVTGINDFFHLTEERIKEFNIENEFLFPLLKSPGETDQILINQENLRLKIFLCRLTKDQLKQQGKFNALHYIEWGEKQMFTSGSQSGLTWPNGSTVKSRKPGWYSIPEHASQIGKIFIPMAIGDRHVTKISKKPLIADNRLYFLSPKKNIDLELIAAILNSSIHALFTETVGRVSLGDGALELKVEDTRDYLMIPNPLYFSDDNKIEILEAFEPLLNRNIESVFEEVQKSDRNNFDSMVLKALGLDSKFWLSEIFNGLITLANERVSLGKMRSQIRKSRIKKAGRLVFDEVLEELLPNGPKIFPENFYSKAALSGQFREVKLPSSPIRYAGHMFGLEELINDEGEIIQVNNPNEVKFLLFTQSAGHKLAKIPVAPVECSRAVNDYVKYLRDLRQQLTENFFRRTLDQAQTERLVKEVWQKLKLPIIEE